MCPVLKKTIADISRDGTLCAVACNGILKVYDTVQNKLMYSFNQGLASVKILKISPSKKVISWLQTNANQVFLSFLDYNLTKAVNTSSNDFTVEFILWSPDGNSLAVFSSHSIFIDIYKIEEASADIIATISGALFNSYNHPIAQFSYDGELFAAVNICKQGHAISIYPTGSCSWLCIQNIFVNGIDQIGGLLWCCDSASFIVWQAKRELKLHLWTVYGRQESSLVQTSTPATCVSLSCCGRMAAILTADGKVQIIDLLTWQPGPMGVLAHFSIIHKSSVRSAVKEPSNKKGQINVCEPIPLMFYELNDVPLLSGQEPLMEFSPNAEYLATYDPQYPNALWVWNLITNPLLDTVVVLANKSQISGMLWHSEKTCLAASLAGNRVLVWTPQHSLVVTNDTHDWPFKAEYYLTNIPVSDEVA